MTHAAETEFQIAPDPDDTRLSQEVRGIDPDQIKARDPYTFESRHRTEAGNDIPVEVSVQFMRFGDDELIMQLFPRHHRAQATRGGARRKRITLPIPRQTVH